MQELDTVWLPSMFGLSVVMRDTLVVVRVLSSTLEANLFLICKFLLNLHKRKWIFKECLAHLFSLLLYCYPANSCSKFEWFSLDCWSFWQEGSKFYQSST